MECIEPKEQLIHLKDGRMIGIDWGGGKDLAVQVTARKAPGGVLEVLETKVLKGEE